MALHLNFIRYWMGNGLQLRLFISLVFQAVIIFINIVIFADSITLITANISTGIKFPFPFLPFNPINCVSQRDLVKMGTVVLKGKSRRWTLVST